MTTFSQNHSNIDSSFYERENCNPPSCLLEAHQGAFYFAKDLQGRFVFVNQKLIEFFKLDSGADIIGKTDHELNSKDLADAYLKDDLRVVQEKAFISNKIELLENGNSTKEWFSTTKGPLYNRHGKVVGIEGIAFSTSSVSSHPEEEPSDLSECLTYIQENYTKSILMKEIASKFHMSISTFEKKFKNTYNMSPKQYLKRYRIQKACEMLRNNHSVKEVTYSTGFCDQSYFTKEFRLTMDMTPNAYKKAFKSSQSAKINLDEALARTERIA
jgi:AraC-like DNA-binding protein